MSSTVLKLIAVITMLIDHVGLAVFPQYAGMRYIGRLAFPLYCFLLTEGAVYTKNWLKYAGRLFLFGVLAEVPFDLALTRTAVNFYYQNVFWTLGAGLVIIRLWYLYGCMRGRVYASRPLTLTKTEEYLLALAQKNAAADFLLEMGLPLLCLLLVFVCDFARTDYGAFGALMIWCLFLAKQVDGRRQNRQKGQYDFRSRLTAWLFSAAVIGVMCLLYGGFEKWGAFASIPVLLYNGRRGWCPRGLQYGFYVFYPLHLLIIALYVMFF